VSTHIRADKVEEGHILAGLDLVEAHGGEIRDPEDCSVVAITRRHDGPLTINLDHWSRGLRVAPDELVEVEQDTPPSVQLAAVMPAGWHVGRRPSITEYRSEPGIRSTVAQVLPGRRGRWHAHVSRHGGVVLLCDTTITSAADAMALAVQALAEVGH
jgi:hypothetical protein